MRIRFGWPKLDNRSNIPVPSPSVLTGPLFLHHHPGLSIPPPLTNYLTTYVHERYFYPTTANVRPRLLAPDAPRCLTYRTISSTLFKRFDLMARPGDGLDLYSVIRSAAGCPVEAVPVFTASLSAGLVAEGELVEWLPAMIGCLSRRLTTHESLRLHATPRDSCTVQKCTSAIPTRRCI